MPEARPKDMCPPSRSPQKGFHVPCSMAEWEEQRLQQPAADGRDNTLGNAEGGFLELVPAYERHFVHPDADISSYRNHCGGPVGR
jgi:hypothetical protein